MKKHETLEDTIVADDDSFVVNKTQLTEAMYLLKNEFEEEFRRGDLMERRGMAGAAIAFAADMPYEHGKSLFRDNQEFHRLVDTLIEGFTVWLAIKDALS